MNDLLINDIHSFKGRTIDYAKPVLVYRNLTRKGKVYSIKQGSLVVGYAYKLVLRDVRFMVNHKAQAKIRETRHRQVHAYAKGLISECACDVTGKEVSFVTYNPYNYDNFTQQRLGERIKDIYTADCLSFDENGLFIYN